MQAVILAGGKGTRLRPLTYSVPKPMLPVMGRPLIAHLLDRLPAEVDEVLLTVSYMADAVDRWATTSKDPALNDRHLIVVDEGAPLGTGGAVANCADHIDGTFLVLNGDLISALDLTAHVARHRERRGIGSLALHAVMDPSRYGVVDLDAETRRIRSFVEKPDPDDAPSDLVNAGAYVLEPEVLDFIPRGRRVSIEREVFPRLVEDERGLYGHPFEGMWVDCGTLESYIGVHRRFLDDAGHTVRVERGTLLRPRAMRLERVVLGAAVTLGDDVALTDCVVHDGAAIGDGARLEGCVVAAGASIGAGSALTRCIVGVDETVAPSTVLQDERVGLRAGDETAGS